MKSIAIDIGNTNIKCGIFENDQLIDHINFNQQKIKSILITVIKKHKPQYSIVADVTGNKEAENILSLHTKLVKWNSKLKLPIKNKYKSKTLGKDRLSLAVDAQTIFPEYNKLIISAGTCITYDFVNSKSEYLGGAISPGLQMRAKALNNFTSKLPLIKVKNNFQLIGNTTHSSLLSGVMNGAIQEAEGMISLYKKQHSDLKVLLTGGDAPLFEANLKSEIFARRDMVLHGLNSILLHNLR